MTSFKIVKVVGCNVISPPYNILKYRYLLELLEVNKNLIEINLSFPMTISELIVHNFKFYVFNKRTYVMLSQMLLLIVLIASYS